MTAQTKLKMRRLARYLNQLASNTGEQEKVIGLMGGQRLFQCGDNGDLRIYSIRVNDYSEPLFDLKGRFLTAEQVVRLLKKISTT